MTAPTPPSVRVGPGQVKDTCRGQPCTTVTSNDAQTGGGPHLAPGNKQSQGFGPETCIGSTSPPLHRPWLSPCPTGTRPVASAEESYLSGPVWHQNSRTVPQDLQPRAAPLCAEKKAFESPPACLVPSFLEQEPRHLTWCHNVPGLKKITLH